MNFNPERYLIKINNFEEGKRVVEKLIKMGYYSSYPLGNSSEFMFVFDLYPKYIIIKNNRFNLAENIKCKSYITAKDFLNDIEQDEEDKDWYYVPPYKGTDGHRLVNAKGELVAVFENKQRH